MQHCAHVRERGDDGASAVEYGLLVAAIAGVISIIVFTLGGYVLHNMFEDTCNSIKNQAALTRSCTG